VCAPYLPLQHCLTCAPWERASLKCTVGPAVTSFMLEAASEPSLVGRRGSEPRDAWQRRSPPQRGGGVQNRGARGSVGALLSGKAGSEATGRAAAPEPSSVGRWGSGAMGHMIVLEPSSAGRRDPKPWNMWQRVVARPTPCLDLKPVYRGTRSAGYRQ
jgi:hypothetical protein